MGQSDGFDQQTRQDEGGVVFVMWNVPLQRVALIMLSTMQRPTGFSVVPLNLTKAQSSPENGQEQNKLLTITENLV